MKTLKLTLILLLFNLTSFYSSSQVAPFVAVHAIDSNGVPNCQQLDTNICFTIFQHSGILDAVNNGLFLMDYNTLTFAIPDWYSDDGVSFYYWNGSGWNSCVEYCGLPPIVINGDSIVYANANHSYSVIDTAGSSYYWVVTNGNILSGQGSGNLQVQWNGQGNGLITLIQTSLSGCVDTLLMNITILGNVSTHEYYSKSIVAFPNPTRNQVNIGGLNGPVCVEVFDINGRLLMTTTEKSIDLNSFANGSYLFKVIYADMIEDILIFKE